jgi:hypothetical protein
VRVLLDESVPRTLAPYIVGHDVTTVVEQGWAGSRNGDLLQLAAAEFDAFITVDKKLPQQQDLRRYAILVVVLDAKTNRLEDLRPLVPLLLERLVGSPASPLVLGIQSR